MKFKKVASILLCVAVCASNMTTGVYAEGLDAAKSMKRSQIIEEEYFILESDSEEDITSTELPGQEDSIDSEESSEQENLTDLEEPSEQEEPTDSEEPSEQEEPTDSEEPSEQEEPTDSEEPSEQEEPTDLEEPSEQEDSTDSEKPSEQEEINDIVPMTGDLEDDAIGDPNTYKIYLPEGYNENRNYPSVYLMPYDGYTSDKYLEDGLQKKLDEILEGSQSLPMVVVMPDYDSDDDYRVLMDELIADVESKYSVIEDSRYRGILGVGVGGYMAMETAVISKSANFYAIGSHMGDFTSEENPWLSFGSVYDATKVIGNSEVKSKYFYIDAPNGTSFSNVEGGTSDIGTALQKKSKSGLANDTEFAILDGIADSGFYLKSMERSLNRFSMRFVENILPSKAYCKQYAITSSEKTVTIYVDLTLTDEISKYTQEVPDAQLKVQMIEPATGKVLATQEITASGIQVGSTVTKAVSFDRENLADGVNTSVKTTMNFLDVTYELPSISLVKVQDTGSNHDEQMVDLMGNWYFNAYKTYKGPDHDWDKIANITPEVYQKWNTVQPALGWWTADFDKTLGGNANFAGYAWYVRTFDIPKEFTKEDLILTVGYFDEANETYVNGKLVGSNGIVFDENGVGSYDGSNPWDVNNVYTINSDLLNYGGKNTIAIRTCNSSGGGGWYEGPVGVYTSAAYNKVMGKPSEYADETAKSAVLAVVDQQKNALEEGKIEKYAETISPDYFHSGYDKKRQLEKIGEWMSGNKKLEIVDSQNAVFTTGNQYVYQAKRVVNGIANDGSKQEIYNGDVLEYYTISNGIAKMYGDHSRFFVDNYIANAIGGVQKEFRVYLPDGYFDVNNTKRYQSMYLLHGINSSSKMYEIDDIDKYLDAAIAAGELEEMIVIIPDDTNKMSWWKGDCENMIMNDLLPTVDMRYRTIDDERYRYTAGCSMGGGGAANIGLFHPNEFSGMISFYGALNYTGANTAIANASAEYLQQFNIWMACGNHDVYNFFEVQEQVSRDLSNKGVEHYHYVDNGEHTSEFYLPLFVPAIQYIQKRLYNTISATDIVSGSIQTEETDDGLNVSYSLDVSADIDNYLHNIVEFSNTTDSTPALQIPLQIIVIQDGKPVENITRYCTAEKAMNLNDTVEISNGDFDINKSYEVQVHVSVLENTKVLDSMKVDKESGNPDEEKPENPDGNKPGNPDEEKPENPDGNKPGNPDEEKPENPDGNKPGNPDKEKPKNPDTNKNQNNSVKTGDASRPMVWISGMLIAGIAMIIIIQKKKVK